MKDGRFDQGAARRIVASFPYSAALPHGFQPLDIEDSDDLIAVVAKLSDLVAAGCAEAREQTLELSALKRDLAAVRRVFGVGVEVAS